MPAFHPWRLTDSEALQVRLLDWAYDDAQQNPGRSHTLDVFHQGGGLNPIDVQQAVKALQSRGMVQTTKPGSGDESGFDLLEPGIADVEARRRRRHDPGHRRQSCRDAFLFWLSTQPSVSPSDLHETAPFLTSQVCIHEGRPFEQADVDEATDYLCAWVLIDGITYADSTALVQARLLPAGWDCLDSGGSVTAWAQRHRASADTNVTSIETDDGEVTGRADKTQYLRIDMAMLRNLLNDVRDDTEPLDIDTAPDVITYVDAIWAEASKRSPDSAIIEHRAQRLDQISTTATGAPTARTVNRLLEWLLPQLG